MEAPNLKRFVEATRTFLLSKMSREALVFAVFVLLSAAFWLTQALNETSELELEYDLELENVPEGTVITSELPSPMHITVRDKGTSLIRYYAQFRRRKLEIDFTQYDRGISYGHVVLPHTDVQKLLAASLDASTRIVTIRPDTLEYYYTRGVSKRVPVEFVGRVETDALSYISSLTIEPDSVTVWAEEHFLDSLNVINTVATTLTDLRKSTTRQIPLAPMKGVKLVPEQVTLTAEVDVYSEKSVNVPIIGTNFPAGYTLRTFPTSATITFRVGSRDFGRYTEENFVLTATYEELISRPDSTFRLQLRSIPEGVSQVRINPEVVQFLIEQVEETEESEEPGE